jgi:hypothetical protein
MREARGVAQTGGVLEHDPSESARWASRSRGRTRLRRASASPAAGRCDAAAARPPRLAAGGARCRVPTQPHAATPRPSLRAWPSHPAGAALRRPRAARPAATRVPFAHRRALRARGVAHLAGEHHAGQAGHANVERHARAQDERADCQARQLGQHLQPRGRNEGDAGHRQRQRGLHHHVVARWHVVRAEDQIGI